MKKIIILIVVLGVSISLYFSWNYFSGVYSDILTNLPKIEKSVTDLISETGKKISTPPPLRSDKESEKSYLTKAGVIEWTNNQRAKYGLSPLKENFNLNESAEKKVEDMFENQYFAHESPDGFGVDYLAGKAGYGFIAIGENLALGNFEDDQDLVQAWMDSPGHKENILNKSYQEIGVSVIKGTFEGKTTWLAVQHFGLPSSACSEPDEFIKLKIQTTQSQISVIEKELKRLKEEIENTRTKRGAVYSQKIEEYNSLVSKYNELVGEAKNLISLYNNQIKLFNECVGSFK